MLPSDPQPPTPSPSPAHFIPCDDPDRMLLIVAGAHLVAEQADRPWAYRLHAAINQHLEPHGGGTRSRSGMVPVVCSDLWYLSHDHLRVRPTIAIGPAEHNALSAFLVGRLPRVFGIDGRLAVQFDLQLRDMVGCCWGIDAPSTGQAVDVFIERYLADWLHAAVTRDA